MTQDAFRPDAWTRACDRFTEDLSEDEKRLYFQATPEEILYEASAADKISDRSSKTRKTFKKLQPLVESIEQYGAALDVFANACSLVMGPLWGSLRIVLHLAREAGQYFERISDMFVDIGEVLPRLHVYERLFPRHERLVQALSVIYCDLIEFCSNAKDAVRHVKRRSLNLTWRNFDRDFGKRIEKFRKHQKLVEKEVNTSHMIESADSRSVVLANDMQARNGRQEREMQRTFSTLSPVNYEAQLERLYNLRQNGTCTWFEDHPVYREWEGSTTSCGLCCSGIPGCGKSVLMSTMVWQQLQRNAGSILYFFCDYSDPTTLLTVNIYRALLKQLFDSGIIPDHAKQRIIEQYRRSSHGPNECDLATILSESIDASHSLRIMIDGLDECSERIQSDLSEQVSRWLNVRNSIVKVLVTCREEENPLRHLRSFANLKVDELIVHADIEAFISKSVESCISGGNLTIKNKDLQSVIMSRLSEKAQGMFLWVHFQLQDLCEATSDHAVQEILDHLPDGLENTYVRILEKIEAGKSQLNKNLVQQTLQWVAFARRPLTLPELQEAVAFGPKDDHWDADKIPDGDKLIGLCHGLIIRDQNRQVRFAHHTVRQHLLRPAVQDEYEINPFQVDRDGLPSPHLMNYYFTNGQADFRLALSCATYLCFSDFESAIVKANEQVVTMNQIFKNGGPMAIPATVGLKRPLFWIPYKIQGGNRHIRLPEIDFSKYGKYGNRHPQVPPEMRDKYALLDYVIQYWPWHTKQRLSKVGRKVHLPRSVREETLLKGLNGNDFLGIHIGCLAAFEKFWDLILHKNLRFEIRPWGLNQHFGVHGCQACPPSESPNYRVPHRAWTSLIHWAAEAGHTPLIVATYPAIMHNLYHERYHQQTLKLACAHDQPELISYMLNTIMLQYGAHIQGEGQYIEQEVVRTEAMIRQYIRRTPYLTADWFEICCKSGALDGLYALVEDNHFEGNEEVKREAFLKGAFAATSNGHLQVLKWLLEPNVVHHRDLDPSGASLLHVAARGGHANVAAELLQRDELFRREEHFPKNGRRDEYFQKMDLLPRGNFFRWEDRLLNWQDAQGQNPLSLASQGGHTKVVQVLVEAGARALGRGGELIDLPNEANEDLLLSGLRTWSQIQHPTAIHSAAANGNYDVLSTILMSEPFQSESKEPAKDFWPLQSTLTTKEKGNLKALDPLECAARYGHERCVELLLDKGSWLSKSLRDEPEEVCSRALHLAATMGHEKVVRLLLQNDADPDSTIEGGVTPLHLAAVTGKTAIIILLLDFEKSNERERTQLAFYERVNRPLSISSNISSQPSPLELAIREGHSEAVEKLIKYGANAKLGSFGVNVVELAITAPKADSATIKAVCGGSLLRQSDSQLLELAIKFGSPAKLQTLFELGLRAGHEMGPESEVDVPRARNLLWEAVHSDQHQFLEVLLENCCYGNGSLKVAICWAKERLSSTKDDTKRTLDAMGRYATKRCIAILEKQIRKQGGEQDE